MKKPSRKGLRATKKAVKTARKAVHRSKSLPKSRSKTRSKSPENRLLVNRHKFDVLKEQLEEAQATLDAIRTGVVDAVVVAGPRGHQVYSLTGAEQPYRVYVEQMQEGAVTVSSDSMVLYCNQRFAKMLQAPLERVISSNLTAYLEPDCWAKISAVFSGAAKVVKYETTLQCQEGKTLPVHLTASRLPMENQEVMCLVVTDSTGQKEKAELRLEMELAKKANSAKDEFLAALSHELRTPLNPVLLMASDGAENQEWPAGARTDFATIRDHVELEARLIDDLLDLTRITHGKLTIEMKPVNPQAVLQEAVRIVRPEMDLKRIALTVSLQAEGFEVSGDPIRLQQVFWNILRNAIKFTPERGAITVTARAELGVDFSVTISDTGIGLKATELKKVFEVFAQGDHAKSGAHRFGGLGLGLAISRKLVEMHSGTIEAFSDGPNLGATFVVRLPLLDAERPAAPLERGGNIGAADCPASNEGIHVLLVEDHEPTRLTLARLLTRRNYRVTTASTVSEARALAEQHQFNLVISDIGLPDGDGIELMKELHKLQNLKGIALTGYGMESDVQRSKDAGFGVHLTKPVRMQSLSAALMKLTS